MHYYRVAALITNFTNTFVSYLARS